MSPENPWRLWSPVRSFVRRQRLQLFLAASYLFLVFLFPTTSDQVSRILRCATEQRVPVTARGAGTGLSGACIPRAGGIVVQIKVHRRLNRDISSGESTRGWA